MDRKVLITGASRGIGRAIAEAFAASGDELFLTCKSSIDKLCELKLYLEEKYKVTCHAISCDMGDFDDVAGMFEEIDDLDIVVNNAGVAWLGLLTDMTPEQWKSLMDTNLNSLFYTSKFAVPLMIKKKSGRIINISSVWGSVGASCEVAYSASKGAVNAFTKALAKELAPSGIAVNAISCGVIDTDMNRKHLTEGDLRELVGEIPADRLGEPEEVADLVLKVAEASTYMTGQIITIDGGWI